MAGAGKTIRELNFMLHMSSERYTASGWVPPVIDTVASLNEGIDNLYKTINQHWEHLLECCRDEFIRREELRVRNQLMDLLKEGLLETAFQRVGGVEGLNGFVKEIVNREKDPYGVTSDLLKKLLGG